MNSVSPQNYSQDSQRPPDSPKEKRWKSPGFISFVSITACPGQGRQASPAAEQISLRILCITGLSIGNMHIFDTLTSIRKEITMTLDGHKLFKAARVLWKLEIQTVLLTMVPVGLFSAICLVLTSPLLYIQAGNAPIWGPQGHLVA